MKNRWIILFFLTLILLVSCVVTNTKSNGSEISLEEIKKSFETPPDSVRPGVYWYFMDGNLSRAAMTADLESMKEAGIGNVLFLEVNVGLPRGKVDFLSEEWQELFAHAMKESKRLGITMTLGVGPGWTGSGGPWVKAEESMRHLVSSSLEVSGSSEQKIVLTKPEPRKPFFGEGTLTPELREKWEDYYQDVVVLAYPTPEEHTKIDHIDEKALFVRAPYTSMAGVKQYLPEPDYAADEAISAAVDRDEIIDLTSRLLPDGTLDWKVPEGRWTILRMGMRNNGAVTRPAPYPGLGFECDKYDTVAFKNHFDAFIGKLFAKSDFTVGSRDGGLSRLHMDSWEMGAQNWGDNFRDAFKTRRGYDPLAFLPVFSGQIVESLEVSERFLWDIRLTSQELILENHAGYIKKMGRRYGLDLSIQPYDMNPCADLDLGAVADVPSCEFWLKGVGFNSSFGCIEATSIAHVLGRPVVAAEAFTADAGREGYIAYPGMLKNQGDWAFATGINKFIYHTFAHKALGESLHPGMTMGPYGVHWDRGQTWWPMVSSYHQYVSRCSFVLQQGQTVADVLYLTPEGAPHVFRPPHSAMEGNDTIPDRKGYNFDGCSPEMLRDNAEVEHNKIVFKGGGSYHLLVLPAHQTMTPELLDKIELLVKAGATVVGVPPVKSPSLTNFTECDKQVQSTAEKMWGAVVIPDCVSVREYGKGKIYWGGELSKNPEDLYPPYDATSELLKRVGVKEDFQSSEPVRYTHKKLDNADIYFVANKTNQSFHSNCTFRVDGALAELWDPLTGKTRGLPEFSQSNGQTTIPLNFDAYQSFFIVFDRSGAVVQMNHVNQKNFSPISEIQTLESPWGVSFDPLWGGPVEEVVFNTLEDWSKRPEEGIKFYSGIAIYRQNFTFESNQMEGKLYLHLGEVKNMASVRLNGKNLGVVWTAPWQVEITDALKIGNNLLEIEVANLWPNRLIGDERFADDGIKNGHWPDWILEGKPRPSDRITFSSHKFYNANSPLLKSGLFGPVKVLSVQY
jgi:hypothetical protein